MQHSKGPLARFGEKFDFQFDRLTRAYSGLLGTVLKYKPFLLIFSAVLILASLGILGILGAELFGAPDMNEFEVSVRLPAGYDLQRTESKMAEIGPRGTARNQ